VCVCGGGGWGFGGVGWWCCLGCGWGVRGAWVAGGCRRVVRCGLQGRVDWLKSSCVVGGRTVSADRDEKFASLPSIRLPTSPRGYRIGRSADLPFGWPAMGNCPHRPRRAQVKRFLRHSRGSKQRSSLCQIHRRLVIEWAQSSWTPLPRPRAARKSPRRGDSCGP